MLSKEEIENIQQAKSNILRENDIESAALIMKAIVWDGLIINGGRVNIAKVAMRQILNFIDEYKNKDYLDVIREKVKANEQLRQLETREQKLIEKIENEEICCLPKDNRIEKILQEEAKKQVEAYKQHILKILKGENDE